jgi:16S rRNA (cytosine1402-N4)-methyltransferase
VLDATLGGGGHSEALLRSGATVLALDRDPASVLHATERLAEFVNSGQITIVRTNFVDVEHVDLATPRSFDAVLLDLGVSSHQIDQPERGFTFRPHAPLDMRMDPAAAHSAAQLLNTLSINELQFIFKEYADEPRARRLAAEVAKRRQTRPFSISDDLVGAIRATLGPRSGPADFARIFQALRIAVNDEIPALERVLPAMRDRLKPSGVMVVISYHSGEDRVVKNAFRDWTRGCICPPRQPMCTCGRAPLGNTLTRKAVIASAEEVARNPRARSARLRAWRATA